MELLKEFLKSPGGKKLVIVLTAGLAAALASKFPRFEFYVEMAAAFVAGGAIMRSPGDMPKQKEEE